jgi:integrase
MAVVEQLADRGVLLRGSGRIWSTSTFRAQMNAACRALGLPFNIHARDLRHTFCSEAMVAGADMRAIMDYVGHKNISSAGLYQTRYEDEVAAAALAFHASRTPPPHLAIVLENNASL